MRAPQQGRELQCAGLFKQMRRAGYQDEFLPAVQQHAGLLVQFDYAVVRAADDEQGWFFEGE